MKHALALIRGVLTLILLAGCGPSPQEIATVTTSAWTPTPAATPIPPTSTPMPYDLTVLVVDESGAPIPGAEIIFPEAGANVPVKTDDKGVYNWKNLGKDNASLKISAQGYNSSEEILTLLPGTNEYTAALQMPPHALLASKACAPGETLLYAEDFQDGQANGWGVYPQGSQILVESDIDVPDNMILLINFEEDGEYQFDMEPPQTNVVWRFWYKPGNSSRLNAGLGNSDPGYFIVMSADEFSLNSYSNTEGRKFLAKGSPVMGKGVWHLLEFSSYNDHLEVWADGTALSYDGVSIPDANKIGIGSAKVPPDSFVRVDDISLCHLAAPFTSMYIPAP